MVRKLLGISFLFCLNTLSGQNIYSLHTLWDDEIKQWEIKLNEGDLEGEISMTWRLKNDITEWNYKIEGKRGTIKQKWDNNPNFWELQSNGRFISVSTIWTNDFRSFKISDENKTIRIERVHNLRDPIEWQIQEKDSYGNLSWYNEFVNDIRDWVIIDELDEEISFEMKLAAVFVSILLSIVIN